MKYFDDMLTKDGFADGEREPAGVDVYRTLYVTVLNELLAAKDADVRVVAYNRFGVHNSCLILHVSPAFYATLDPQQAARGVAGTAIPPEALRIALDDAYDDAVQIARDMGLDDYITVQADLETLEDHLAAVLEEEDTGTVPRVTPFAGGYTLSMDDGTDSLGTYYALAVVKDASGQEVFRTTGPDWYRVQGDGVTYISAQLRQAEATP